MENAIVFNRHSRHCSFMSRRKAAEQGVASAGLGGTENSVAERMHRCVEAVFEAAETDSDLPPLPYGIAQACESLVLNGAETCRLVALTVTSATAVDQDVPPNIIQAGAGGRDFRSLYKEAVYPVLLAAARRRSAPWQPSRDPFVSNPYREPVIDAAWVGRRKNKLAGAAALFEVVSHLAETRDNALAVLRHLALHELALLERSLVIYRIPPRLSTIVVIDLLSRWLADDSGGRRHEGASVALLRFAGLHLRSGWDVVGSHHVNDPTPFDALCKMENVVRAIGEVKAQTITIDHLRQLAAQMDFNQARRGYLFTRSTWIPAQNSADGSAIREFLRDQDALGRRIDILDVLDTARLWLPLLDQQDETLPAFVRLLADELDDHALAEDRRALARLLEAL
jgi:hypothetical protein